MSLVLRTERLELRELEVPDAPFIVELFNDPSFIENIGDRGVRDEADARRYITEGPRASYAMHGYGLWLVQGHAAVDAGPLGICGIVRRDWLPDPDIGFAFLPGHRGRGYALEAARSVLAHARGPLALPRIAAIVASHNQRSIRLLARLGLRHEGSVLPPGAALPIELHATGAARG